MEPVQSTALQFADDEYLAAWNPDAHVLFVQALSESRVGSRVAVRIALRGRSVRATVHGRIAMVRRIGRPSLPPGVEIQVDPGSVAAAEYLAAVAGGRPFSFQVRAPRYARQQAVMVSVRGADVEARTLTVSDGGCSIEWPGEDAPTPGEVIELRLSRGLLAPVTGAVVCWTSSDAPRRTVGMRVLMGGRGGRAWKALVDDAAQGDAPIA